MKVLTEVVLLFTPLGLVSAVALAYGGTKDSLLYWIGFVLFGLSLGLAGYALVKLNED